MRIYALLKTLKKHEQYCVTVFISDNRFAPCQGLCCTCRLGAQKALLCKTAENIENIIHRLGEVEMGVQWTTGLIGIINVMAWNVCWEREFIICVFLHIRQWCLEDVNLGEDFLFSNPVLCFLSNPPFPQHTFLRISISVLHCKYVFTGEISRSVYKALLIHTPVRLPAGCQGWETSFTVFNPIC